MSKLDIPRMVKGAGISLHPHTDKREDLGGIWGGTPFKLRKVDHVPLPRLVDGVKRTKRGTPAKDQTRTGGPQGETVRLRAIQPAPLKPHVVQEYEAGRWFGLAEGAEVTNREVANQTRLQGDDATSLSSRKEARRRGVASRLSQMPRILSRRSTKDRLRDIQVNRNARRFARQDPNSHSTISSRTDQPIMAQPEPRIRRSDAKPFSDKRAELEAKEHDHRQATRKARLEADLNSPRFNLIRRKS